MALLPIICVLLKSRPTAQFSKLPNGIVQTLNLPYSNCLLFLLSNFLLKGSVVAGKGDMFLLETNDNKVYLAEVDKQKNGDSKSKKELNHDEKETSSHNYEAEGANGDYTDSYEAADKQGNKSEMIKNESEDDDDIIITDSLKSKLAAARRRRKKKGSDYSSVGKDSSEKKENRDSKYLTQIRSIFHKFHQCLGRLKAAQCASILQTQYSFSDQEKKEQVIFRCCSDVKMS